jgi:hypothetical protein
MPPPPHFNPSHAYNNYHRGANNFQPSHYYHGNRSPSSSDAGSDSDSSFDSAISIVPKQRSDHDGYNRFKTPSGKVGKTQSGQQVELFLGTHEGCRRDALGNTVQFSSEY